LQWGGSGGSVIQGGGRTSRKDNALKRWHVPEKTYSIKAAQADLAHIEMGADMKALKRGRIEAIEEGLKPEPVRKSIAY
jgi:hypothetical protein